MSPLSDDERRCLAEIERHLTSQPRANQVVTRKRRTRRILVPGPAPQRWTVFRRAIPPVLLVVWIAGGLLFSALLSGQVALVLAAGVFGVSVTPLTACLLRRRRQHARSGRRPEGLP